MLYGAVDAISNFLDDAEVQENDENADVYDMIPSIESEVCQAHRYYYCKTCNQSVKGSTKSFNEHFFGNKHLKNLRVYESSISGESRNNRGEARNYEPQPPFNGSTDSLASTKSATSSIPKVIKKERLNSLPVEISQLKQNRNEILPKKMCEFLSSYSLDNFSVELMKIGADIMNSKGYQKVCNLIERQLSFRVPGIKALPFGSMIIGLAGPDADLDIYIDIGNCFTTKPSKRRMKDAIHTTQRIFASNGNQWGDFEAVTKARTPILKVYCRAEKIDCDLSFSNGLSVCNTSLIQYFVNLQPVCRKLILFIKFWQKQLQLGLNSYIVSQLVIFYLQQEQVLPTVEKLQLLKKPYFIDGWRSDFIEYNLHDLRIPLATDFKKFLLGFLQYYGFRFDFNRHIVSILAGVPIDKELFDHGREANLPPLFDRFALYMQNIVPEEADEVEDLFSNRKPFVIQDPFELCHNVAKGIQAPKLLKIVNYMRRSFEILSQREKI